MSSLYLFAAFVATSFYFASGDEVTISNNVPRRDTDGDIISAGDGCISYHPDEQLYYLFGAHYQPCEEPNNDCYSGKTGEQTCSRTGFVAEGECCGWRNTTIASWSSPDLVTWRKEGLNILPLATSNPASPLSSNFGAIFEPCGVYNRKTRFWTLFFLRDGYTLASAVARNASGPFSVLQWSVPVPGFATIVDFYFWQSLDGTLIMKHNGGGGESAVILSDNYLSITNSSTIFGKELGYTEGGGIFQYGDSTYVMAGYGCCFCTLGSNGFLWQSNTGVLGPYNLLGDFVPYNPDHSSITHSQQFSVTPVYTSTGVQPMFIGVRFGSAPDFRKDHDFQYWFPLTFNETSGIMKNVSWIDSFTLDLAVPVVPPLPPPPPAPWYACSFDLPGTCFEVPAGAPGASPSLNDCEAACIPEYVCSFSMPGGQCIAVPPGIIPGASSSCSVACAPEYICSLTTPGVCESAPHGTPGAVTSLADCQKQCILCNVAGVWVGQEKGINITITQQQINSTASAVSISVPPGVWPSSATGYVELGRVSITNGWCGKDECVGLVTPLVPGGVQCAEITWEAGSWCSPALDPQHCNS